MCTCNFLFAPRSKQISPEKVFLKRSRKRNVLSAYGVASLLSLFRSFLKRICIQRKRADERILHKSVNMLTFTKHDEMEKGEKSGFTLIFNWDFFFTPPSIRGCCSWMSRLMFDTMHFLCTFNDCASRQGFDYSLWASSAKSEEKNLFEVSQRKAFESGVWAVMKIFWIV